MARITPEEGNFKKLLNQDVIYRVPQYQRNYSWEEEHWEDLWEDIETIIESKEPHYMGPIVLKGVENAGNNSYEIIDGQQRFCTITLIILATIKIIKEKNDEASLTNALVEDLKRRYIGIETPLSAKRKLYLNKNDDDFFEINMVGEQEPNRNNENHLIYKAFKFFYSKLNEKFEEKSAKDIAEFVDKFLLENLSFFIIRVSDEVNAYIIFETLNARGLELSNTDLIKNYLFSLVPQNDTVSLNFVESRWERIVDLVGYKCLPNFMRYYWISKYKFVRNPYLFKELKREISSHEQINNFFQSLERYAIVFSALSDKESSYWSNYPNVKNYISELKILSNEVFKILALAVCSKMESDIVQCLQMCSVIAMRNLITGRNPNEFEKLYSKIALKIENGEITNVLGIKNELSASYVKDTEFKDSFKNKILKFSSNKKKIKYILLKLEKDASSTEHEDNNSVSIEHILPQNPNANWCTIFNNKQKDYIERLGNYTLLTVNENKDCEGKSFLEKKITYTATKFQLSKNIARLDSWDIGKLEERQNELSDRAKHIWRIDFTS